MYQCKVACVLDVGDLVSEKSGTFVKYISTE